MLQPKSPKSTGSTVIWLTGLSASGKSTIARKFNEFLKSKSFKSFVLDGDALRTGINSDLGFSRNDRSEASRRTSEIARLFADSGVIPIVAMISPFAEDRKLARELIAPHRFIEVWVNTDLETCIQRDPKGLYQKSLTGAVPLMTGIAQDYEAPLNPDLEVSGLNPPEFSVMAIYSKMLEAAD